MVGEGAALAPSDVCPEIEISSALGAQHSNDLVALPALICRGAEKHRGDKKKVETMMTAEGGERDETIKGRRKDAQR